MVHSPGLFRDMLNYKGKNLVTTDGTSLLGADDKAGIAAIMDALEYMVNHPEFKQDGQGGFHTRRRNLIRIDHFNVKKFGADLAYTVDGGREGEMEYENFNAARAYITTHGSRYIPAMPRV